MATTTKTPAHKPAAPKRPRAAVHKKAPVHREPEASAEIQAVAEPVAPATIVKPVIEGGRYAFATGRRKTAIANVRLFSGSGESTVNKKPLDSYFGYRFYRQVADEAFDRTGLAGDFYFTATLSGGGPHAQAGALRHGIALALAGLSQDVRKVLKKNGLLTRDPREKERKKPGLKRARRRPQWAKR